MSYEGYPQFLTHDTSGSGPTREKWNVALGLRWRRGTLGDWLDASQRPNGAVPYATEAIPAAGRYSLNVTNLVARWLGNGQNKGAYLRSTGTAYPFDWAGRLHATIEARPMLVVTTSTGTVRIPARANASWHISTAYSFNTSAKFRTNPEGPAIVHFDLRTVTGSLVSAELELSCVGWQRNGNLEVLEADPPTFLIPDAVAQPALGIAAETANWAALAAHPDVITATDFNSASVPSGFTPPAERILNAATGTTYARATIAQGAFESADVRRDVARGTGPQGRPNVVYEELFGQYWIYFEDDFGTVADTAIKIPAMGAQFGYWNDVGYWQQTTGNGGYPGTGLKVWNAAKSKWEYQGHSVRILTGVRPPDGSNYDGLFGVGFYPYNLDQVGPFPAGEAWPNIVLRRGRWYCIDIRVKQNTMSGSQDANGNYATANPDGVMEAWVNGHPAYSKKTFRWRRHAEFGVQGMWIDVYHGGTIASPSTMHYRVDRVSIARRYIGPPRV